MSAEIDGVAFKIDFSDLKPSTVQRLLREAVTREMERGRMASDKSPSKSKDDNLDMADEDDDEESESDKLVRLQEETKGKPAPIPVTAEDFSEKTMRSVSKSLPAPKAKKRSKA